MTIDNWGLTEYNDHDLCAICVGGIGNAGFKIIIDNDDGNDNDNRDVWTIEVLLGKNLADDIQDNDINNIFFEVFTESLTGSTFLFHTSKFTVSGIFIINYSGSIT